MRWWAKEWWRYEPMDEVEETIFGFVTSIIIGTTVVVTIGNYFL